MSTYFVQFQLAQHKSGEQIVSSTNHFSTNNWKNVCSLLAQPIAMQTKDVFLNSFQFGLNGLELNFRHVWRVFTIPVWLTPHWVEEINFNFLQFHELSSW